MLAIAGLLFSVACSVPEEIVDAGIRCDGGCEGNAVRSCGEDGGLVLTPCEEGGRCASDSPSPQCVPVNALPCEPDGDAGPACSDGGVETAEVCDDLVGYMLEVSCDDR